MMNFSFFLACLPAATILVGGVQHAMPQTAYVQRHEAAHMISSNRMRVEIMDPNDPERYYQGQRFSPVAGVLQVRMDGVDFLYSDVVHNPLKDGGGLMMEFDISGSEPPPGFNDVAEGEGFVKVGVGVLKKRGDEYRFYEPYEMLAPAKTTVEWEASKAVFHQTCEGVAGYAYQLDSVVEVRENWLKVWCQLRNTGTKPFSTEQYAHNFFRFDDIPIGLGYQVELPREYPVENIEPVVEARGSLLVYVREMPPKMKAVNAVILADENGKLPSSVSVSCPAKGVRIQASVLAPVSRFALHSVPKYICPEQFVRLNLAPGAATEWARSYEFCDGK